VTRALYPFDLTWAEVDPAKHRFDAATAERVVAKLPPARRVPHGKDDAATAWCDAMTRELVERYGRWAVGWRWARDEGDLGGGPVTEWCCPPHSMKSPAQTPRLVAAALSQWRAWLERLAALFEEHRLTGVPLAERHRVWRRAAVEVIAAVVEQTRAGDAWYAHCHQALGWYLARWGVPENRAQTAVRKAIGGRFESWVEPAEDLVGEVVDGLKLKLG